MIRHLYKRPLDTLLATWGLSAWVCSRCFRSIFGAREVSATLPDWLMGSWQPSEIIDIPINGLFVMGLTFAAHAGVIPDAVPVRLGARQVRATVQNRMMAGAVGINTKRSIA